MKDIIKSGKETVKSVVDGPNREQKKEEKKEEKKDDRKISIDTSGPPRSLNSPSDPYFRGGSSSSSPSRQGPSISASLGNHSGSISLSGGNYSGPSGNTQSIVGHPGSSVSTSTGGHPGASVSVSRNGHRDPESSASVNSTSLPEGLLESLKRVRDERRLNRTEENRIDGSSDSMPRVAKTTKKENFSITGELAERTVNLALKPLEIALKPFDKVLGFDKDKKSPFLRLIDDVIGFYRKPIDAIAEPLERILKKMGDDDRSYLVSVRFPEDDIPDPKFFTRLTDGALNTVNRIFTKPLEIVVGKKSPIIEAARSLNNATKLAAELFTRPIDRIVKEINELGEIKDEAEREALYVRKKEEASRLVRMLNKIHDNILMKPFQIVLRPISRTIGSSQDNEKDPFVRASDVIHQAIVTPLQVVSKPVEDAIFGEQTRKPGSKLNPRINATNYGREGKKNFIVDGIKRVEKIAVKPLKAFTAPLRRFILNADEGRLGSGAIGSKLQPRSKSDLKKEDKILRTVENVNNVILKPLEIITQPIADFLSPENRRENEKRARHDKKASEYSTYQSKSPQRASAQAQSQRY